MRKRWGFWISVKDVNVKRGGRDILNKLLNEGRFYNEDLGKFNYLRVLLEVISVCLLRIR